MALIQIAEGLYSTGSKEDIEKYPEWLSRTVLGLSPFLFTRADGKTIDLWPVLHRDVNLAIIADAAGIDIHAKHQQSSEKPQIEKKGSQVFNSEYYRLYRFIKKLEKDKFVKSEKGILDAGFGDRPSLWYHLTKTGYNLMKEVQISNRFANEKNEVQIMLQKNQTRENQKAIPKWLKWPAKSNPRRIRAIKKLNTLPTNTGLFWNTTHHGGFLNPNLVAQLDKIDSEYHKYLDEIEDKKIILTPRENPDSDYHCLDYVTRFNCDSRKYANLDTFNDKWAEAEQHYKSGVFVTLTTDPKLFKNLWEANRHMSVAWNAYISLLTRRRKTSLKYHYYQKYANEKYGKPNAKLTNEEKREAREKYNEDLEKFSFRPRYVGVNEFQKNGLIHFHVVLFDIDYLDEFQLSRDWNRLQQGQIVDVCKIQNDGPDSWKWKNARPSDANSEKYDDPRKYLKKYLNKIIFQNSGYHLYWSINKKFFLCSQRMQAEKLTPEMIKVRAEYRRELAKFKAETGTGSYWTFAGCIPSLLIPDFIADRSARKKYYPVPEYVIPVSVGVLIDREKMSEHPPLEDRPPGFVSAAQLYLERQNSAGSAGGQIKTLADLW